MTLSIILHIVYTIYYNNHKIFVWTIMKYFNYVLLITFFCKLAHTILEFPFYNNNTS